MRVEPGVLAVLNNGIEDYQISRPGWSTKTSGRRLARARWLVQPSHPLTARVMVNRIWQNHFGRTGERPSHPELLDWLATEFVRQDWSVKALHRLIMTSAAYRQSSKVDPQVASLDPDGRLLSRFPLRRMDAEVIRDSILKVAGRLDRTPFGPADEVKTTPQGEVVSVPSRNGYRRSIYMKQKRETLLTTLTAFDAPRLDDGNPNCLRREYSTVATQALQLMNSELVSESAQYFAGRVMDAVSEDLGKQVEWVYLSALSRRPSAVKRELGRKAIEDLTRYWLEHLEQEVPPEPKRAKAEWSALSRRDFFSRFSDGLHGTALAYLLGEDLFAVNPALPSGHRQTYDLKPRPPHFEGKAKAMIQIFMTGGPSQVDLFDPKPALEKYAGQPPGRDLIKDILFIADAGGLMPSPFKFAKHGESGMELSELLPHLAKHVDNIALIRSTSTTNFTHGPATFLMQGGHILTGRPSMGAWVLYALGSESQDLLPTWYWMIRRDYPHWASETGSRLGCRLFTRGLGYDPRVLQF